MEGFSSQFGEPPGINKFRYIDISVDAEEVVAAVRRNAGVWHVARILANCGYLQLFRPAIVIQPSGAN
jgi:hypothetical protein